MGEKRDSTLVLNIKKYVIRLVRINGRRLYIININRATILIMTSLFTGHKMCIINDDVHHGRIIH